MLIRKYSSKDREQVENIHFETGFLGKSLSIFLSNNKLWKKSARFYLEKGDVFVLDNKGKIEGYLFGCTFPHFGSSRDVLDLFSNFFKSLFLSKKDRKFWRSRLLTLFEIVLGVSGELKLNVPKGAGHIHINLLPSARGKGYGSKLLHEFEELAKSKLVNVIYANSFETDLNPNKNFWLKNGFVPHSRVKSTFWKRYLPNENIFLVCYVKEL